MNDEVGHGTVQPADPFDPDADATALRNAMKGLGESHCLLVTKFISTRLEPNEEFILAMYIPVTLRIVSL